MSSLGDRLLEVVVYDSIGHIGPKVCLIRIWHGNCTDLPVL